MFLQLLRTWAVRVAYFAALLFATAAVMGVAGWAWHAGQQGADLGAVLSRPAVKQPNLVPSTLFGNFAEKAGTDAAGKIADAIRTVKWPRRITATGSVEFEYVGDPPPAE